MRGAKVLPIVAVGVGVVLIAAAFVTAFYITPTYVARLPSDAHADRSYAGTFKTLLDPQAVAQGNLAGALKQNVPLSVSQHIKAEQTSGNTALVSDARTTTAAGTTVEKTTWQYALNRRTLEPTTNHPSSWSVINAQGLTVSWPVGASKKTYTGWVPETASTTPVTFSRSETHAGLSTYVYLADIAPARISDPQLLAGLPAALPQSLLRILAELGPLTPTAKQQLTALLPTLGDPVPISYTLQGKDTIWVEPETGVVIDVSRVQQRIAGIVAPNGGAFIPLLPVVDAAYQQTSASVASAVHDADRGRKAIELFGTTLPVIAGAVGLVLLVLGLVPLRRRRRSSGEEAVSTTPGDSPGTTPGDSPGTTPGDSPGTTPGDSPGTTPGEDA